MPWECHGCHGITGHCKVIALCCCGIAMIGLCQSRSPDWRCRASIMKLLAQHNGLTTAVQCQYDLAPCHFMVLPQYRD